MEFANPIYDIAFKYLMEDEEIARGLLSTIIGEEIVHLQMLPQESIMETQKTDSQIDLQVLRFDFKSVFKFKVLEICFASFKDKKAIFQVECGQFGLKNSCI